MNNFPSKEYELIQRVRAVLPPVGPRSPYEVTIGDDAAVRVNRIAGERLVVTADVSVENVHFTTDAMTFEEIGCKSMASNLSDCAAMGARPDGAVVQLVFPKIGVDNAGVIDSINPAVYPAIKCCAQTGEHSSPLQNIRDSACRGELCSPAVDNINTAIEQNIRDSVCRGELCSPAVDNINTAIEQNIRDSACRGELCSPAVDNINTAIEQIYAGFSKACRRWDFPIIGGDLSGGAVWTIGITLIGSAPPGGRLLRRTGVADGDALWVTGFPGESAAGFAAIARWGRRGVPPRYKRFVDAHVAPEPAVDEGAALASEPSVHAMMDLSDGLSKDIATLCFDNRLGFIFDADVRVRGVSPDMAGLADDLSADCLEWFYHGGEEYELLFACDPLFDPRGVDNIARNKPGMMRLGHFTSKARGVLIPGSGGEAEELRAGGWDHFKIKQ